MDAFTTILGVCVVVLIWLMAKRTSGKRLRLPTVPGGGLPLLGHLLIFLNRPEVETNEESDFVKYGKELGDIYMISLAGTYAYILNSPTLVQTAFSSLDTRGRPPNKSHKRAFGSRAHGIILSQGEEWKAIRKFTQDLFRRLGVGRARFEECISSEVDRVIASLNELPDSNRVTNIQYLIQKAIMNIVSGIILGKQFDYNEAGFKKMIEIIESYLTLTGPSGPDSLALMFPIGKGAQLRKSMADFKTICEESIEDHKETVEDGEQKDFVGAFLVEMKSSGDQPNEVFNHENMMACCLDMFVAGVDTIASSLTYAILFLVSNPEVQEKCHGEISRVVGRDKRPTSADKDNLPYLQAVISETLRMANVAPFGAPHVATKDLEMFDYDVPKGTMFLANYGVIFNKEEKYPNPLLFDPERFLANGVYQKDAEFCPFGTGSRMCPGEQLARMELILFLSALLQQFRFLVPEGAEKPEVLSGKTGGTRSPLPYDVLVETRT